MGRLFDVALANLSASEFSALGMYFMVKPWNLCSKALIVSRYLISSGSLAM
jgi:hypothetical protein